MVGDANVGLPISSGLVYTIQNLTLTTCDWQIQIQSAIES
ncbi:hypothetical protein LPU83_3110 [Rhizobium favelukesii]|uniref:Uncharacterized protein n=1 Tax=Rhizobium favelukesii TaxID=348824 RepID=W6REL9_9HYPH|nr:hypothetical protein LPU83_3110 [Rhizobium favelukesii]